MTPSNKALLCRQTACDTLLTWSGKQSNKHFDYGIRAEARGFLIGVSDSVNLPILLCGPNFLISINCELTRSIRRAATRLSKVMAPVNYTADWTRMNPSWKMPTK